MILYKTVILLQVVHEAQIASKFLNTEAQENFDLLLMTPCPFQMKFDHIFRYSTVSCFYFFCCYFCCLLNLMYRQ
jgi:hypothetical protein